MTNRFDKYIDQLIKYVQPIDIPTQSWKDTQIEHLEKALAIFGTIGFDKKVNEWIVNNQQTSKTFGDMVQDLKIKSYHFPKNFSLRALMEDTKLRDEVSKPTQKVARPEVVRVWKEIYKDHKSLNTSDLDLDPLLSDLLHQQFPDYTIPPLMYILKYVSWSFSVPLVIGAYDMRLGILLLKDLHAKLHRLYDNCVVSPSVRDYDLCPQMFWEDFLQKTWTDYHEKLLHAEKLSINRTKLGLFCLHASDVVENYHPKFRQLLRHFVYNEKCIILLDTNMIVSSNHWLIKLLRNSFTIELR